MRGRSWTSKSPNVEERAEWLEADYASANSWDPHRAPSVGPKHRPRSRITAFGAYESDDNLCASQLRHLETMVSVDRQVFEGSGSRLHQPGARPVPLLVYYSKEKSSSLLSLSFLLFLVGWGLMVCGLGCCENELSAPGLF